MEKHKYIIFQIFLGIILIPVILSSCEDFLDEVPGDKITTDQNYKTSIDAFSSTIGAFSLLQEIMPDLVILNDLRSDLMVETENFDSDLRDIDRHNILITNKYIDPSGFYRIIYNANLALNNLENIQKYDRNFDSLSLVFCKIDMISLRSWAYFTLVRLYGEAAYIPQNMISYDENYQFEYYDKNRMIDTLLGHMDSTLTYPDLYVNQDVGTVFLYDRALKGELYLEKGDFKNAVAYLINAIGGPDIGDRFLLEEYNEESWQFIFQGSIGQRSEVMSVIPFSYIDNQENPLFDIFSLNKKYLIKPSDIIVNLFDSQMTQQGKQGDTFRGKGISYAYDSIESKFMVNKYSLNSNEFSGADIIIYRAADIQLFLAEALNQMGDHSAALDILNNGYKIPQGWRKANGVRNRVLLTQKNMPTDNVKNAIEDMIMEERAMELAFEGKRWFDLVRVANRRGASYLADKVSAKYNDQTIASEVNKKLMDTKNWYLPFRK